MKKYYPRRSIFATASFVVITAGVATAHGDPEAVGGVDFALGYFRPCAYPSYGQNVFPVATQRPSPGFDPRCGGPMTPSPPFFPPGMAPSMPDGGPPNMPFDGSFEPGTPGSTPSIMPAMAVDPAITIDTFHLTPQITVPGLQLPNRFPMPVGQLSYNGYTQGMPDYGLGAIDPAVKMYQGQRWFQNTRPEVFMNHHEPIYIYPRADRSLDFMPIVTDEDCDEDCYFFGFPVDEGEPIAPNCDVEDGCDVMHYKGINGTTGMLKNNRVGPNEGQLPGTIEYNDQRGFRYVFINTDGVYGASYAGGAAGQLWKVVATDGSDEVLLYTGHDSSLSSALNSFETDGPSRTARPTFMVDSADRRWLFTYADVDPGSGVLLRLSSIRVQTKTGGNWTDSGSLSGVTDIAKMEYDYYEGDELTDETTPVIIGQLGDLKFVKCTMPSSDGTSGTDVSARSYWRYVPYRGEGNITEDFWHSHLVKLVVGPEGVRRFEQDFPTGNIETATYAVLRPYAKAYFEYRQTASVEKQLQQLALAEIDGVGCGCGSSTGGAFQYSHEENAAFDTGGKISNSLYDAAGVWNNQVWMSRTIIKQPDLTMQCLYYDEVGQLLGTVTAEPMQEVTDGPLVANEGFVPGTGLEQSKLWITRIERDEKSRIVRQYSPAAMDWQSYDHTPSGTDLVLSPMRLDEDEETSDAGLVTFQDWFRAGNYSGEDYLPFAIQKLGHYPVGKDDRFIDRVITYVDPAGTDGKPWDFAGIVRVAKAYAATDQIVTANDTEETGGSLPTGSYVTTTYERPSYHSAGTSGSPWRIKRVNVSEPVVVSGENGSGSATTISKYMDADQRLVFAVDQRGVCTYYEYDSVTGLPTKVLQDVSSDSAGSAATSAATSLGVSLPTSGGFNISTTSQYDGQGRPVATSVTSPATSVVRTSVAFYTKLSTGSVVTLSVPRRTGTSSYTYYSPVSYTVTGLNGQLEASGVISFTGGSTTTDIANWIDESEASGTIVISAVDTGTVANLTTTSFTLNGSHAATRKLYSSITTPTTEDTSFGFDNMGRLQRVVDPTGTVTRTIFDALGRRTATWVGTDDTGWDGGMTGGSDNMTKTASVVYDSGGVGNSLVTSQVRHVDSNSSHDRVTAFLHDYRGRALITINETAPHSAVGLDNLGRVTAAAQYADASDLSATFGSATDPAATSGDPAISDRRALAKSFYDAKGQVWKSERFSVDGSGALTDSIVELNWYDPAGLLLKTRGTTVSKSFYDRLGRPVRTFAIGADDDTAYADVDDVAGDTVMEEMQSYLDPTTGDLLAAISISRHPNDSTTTGALDTDDDLSLVDYSGSKIKGRASISAFYQDDPLDRTTHTVTLGTNGGANYDRDSVTTPPATSSTVLVTITRFNSDGTTLETEDPLGRIQRNIYDSARRTVKTIANYENGTPGSTTAGDDDQVIEYEFTNGLMTKLTAKLPSSSDDQVTTYTYGVQQSGSNTPLSTFADNRLLRKVQYPDSSGGSDVVRYAYNAQQERTVTLDQAGNQIETEYDDMGRELNRRATTIASGFDNLVRRIGLAYDTLGRTSTVTQYDVGDVALDQVKYEYDGWGNLTEFEQDVDSAIGASSGRAEFSVGYIYAKSTPTGGSYALRRTAMKHNGTDLFSYVYGSSGSVSDKMSRVSSLSMNSVTIASYQYAGVGMLATTSLNEAGVSSSAFNSSTSAYDGWDRFSRPVESWWQNDASDVRFYDLDIAYDVNSNITETVDNLHVVNSTGKHVFDVLYANDNLNRLRDAYEGNVVTNGSSQREVESGTATRREQWNGLSLTGNWGNRKLDANGDGDYSDATDLDEADNVFNKANEWTAREARGVPTEDDWDYTYDAVGNMVEEELSRFNGASTAVSGRVFVYDPFGRLRKVEKRPVIVGQDPTIAEYRYNGLGFRTMWKYDATPGGGLTNDERYYFLYDEQWRVAATYRNADSSPKERFIHHAAGIEGAGDSSYIDSVVLRDRDNTSGWTAASDGTLEERRYYCQNWRADVVAMVKQNGQPVEWVRYSAYGEPTVYPLADFNCDGIVNAADETAFSDEFDTPGSAGVFSADLDFSGSTDTDDFDRFTESYAEFSGMSGIGAQSHVGNRLGYAGYQWDHAARMKHVRHRVYRPDLGRWMARDRLGYVDGMSLYQYVVSQPSSKVDPTGEWSVGCIGCAACVIAVTGSCGYLCTTQPWWDVRGEGWFMCMGKCYLAALEINLDLFHAILDGRLPSASEFAMGACDYVCGKACAGQVVRWLKKKFLDLKPPGWKPPPRPRIPTIKPPPGEVSSCSTPFFSATKNPICAGSQCSPSGVVRKGA